MSRAEEWFDRARQTMQQISGDIGIELKAAAWLDLAYHDRDTYETKLNALHGQLFG